MGLQGQITPDQPDCLQGWDDCLRGESAPFNVFLIIWIIRHNIPSRISWMTANWVKWLWGVYASGQEFYLGWPSQAREIVGRNLMKFNKTNCKALHLGLNNTVLAEGQLVRRLVHREKDQGVTMTSWTCVNSVRLLWRKPNAYWTVLAEAQLAGQEKWLFPSTWHWWGCI